VQNYNSIHLTGLLSGVNTNHGNHGNYIESLRIVYHVVIRKTIKVVACYCIDASLRLGRTCILKSEMRGSATGAVSFPSKVNHLITISKSNTRIDFPRNHKS
jgi:hypothetical protein